MTAAPRPRRASAARRGWRRPPRAASWSPTRTTAGSASWTPICAAVVLGADRPRARLTLRYAATTDAAVQCDVMRGSRRVTRITARAHNGRNTIRLRAPARAGRYSIRLIATTARQRATDTARLTVAAR